MKRVNINLDIDVIFHDENPKAHGLDDNQVMDYLMSKESSVLVVPDAGTNDRSRDKKLSEMGWKIYCIDHHVSEEEVNTYATIVNNQMSPRVTNKQLSGTGVTHKVLCRMDELYGTDYASDLISYVHLSNISDARDFIHPEQQTYRYWSFNDLADPISHFVEVFNREGNIDNTSFSFGCISKMNALIRVGNLDDKKLLFDALCGDPTKYYKASDACLECYNLQAKMVEETLDNVDIVCDNSIVIGRINAKTPLTGLIANKLMSQYNKPIFLVHEHDGECAGSVRSPVPILDVVRESGLFTLGMGHQNSFGVGYLLDDNNEQKIIDYFNDPNNVSYVPCKTVVKSIPLNSTLDSYYRAFEWTMFFGKGIEEPQWHITDIEYYPSAIQFLGKNKRTLKLKTDRADIMFFNVTNATKEKLGLGFVENKVFVSNVDENKHKMSLIGKLSVNEWNGNCTNQIIVDDFESEVVKMITAKDVFRKRG